MLFCHAIKNRDNNFYTSQAGFPSPASRDILIRKIIHIDEVRPAQQKT
jgi:hypothetical protein